MLIKKAGHHRCPPPGDFLTALADWSAAPFVLPLVRQCWDQGSPGEGPVVSGR